MRSKTWMTLLAAGAAFALPVTAAAARYGITPMPAGSQTLSQVGGKPTLSSTGSKGSASLTLRTEVVKDDEVAHFLVGVKNEGGAALQLTPEMITVATDAGPGRVLTVTDLEAAAVKEHERKKRLEARRTRGIAAGQPDATSYSGDGISANSTNVFGDSTMMSIESTGAGTRVSKDELTPALLVARASGFRPAVVGAGMTEVLPMPIDRLPKKASALTITVSVNGEPHSFRYAIAKR